MYFQRTNCKRPARWEWLRSEIYIRDKGICWVCNEFTLLKDYQLGHIIDRTNNGADALDNCAVMHKVCNNTKPRHKSIEEASRWRLTPKKISHTSYQETIENSQLTLLKNELP